MYWNRWAAASLVAAALATAADAALLQRSRSYFTGGFLAADTLDSATSVAVFLTASLLADFVVAGVVVMVVLWLCGRHGVRPRTAAVLAIGTALAPIAAADFVDYELAAYLGDAFEARLLFDLAGRDVSEFLAVGSAHLWALAAVGVPLAVILLWLARRVVRRGRSAAPWPNHPSLRSAMLITLLVVVAGSALSAAIRRSSDVMDNGLRRKASGQWLGVLVNTASDLDRDGYGLLGRPPDIRLFDGRVHPYALDWPGNSVDDDGVGGDLPASAPPYREGSKGPPAFARRPDIILFVLESFRADAMGAHLRGQPVTPTLDELGRRGVSSRAAFSHNGYTVQARHHVFSGSIADLRGGTTLIDDFKANGYETAYFSGQDESFGGAGFGVGFERADVAYDARVDKDKRYSTYSTAGSLAVPNGLLVQRVSEFLDRRSPSKPLFLYVNFHDTHFPYHHPGIEPLLSHSPLPQAEISPSRAAELHETYLNTAANVDRAIGRVLDVAGRRLRDQPAVIVIADHGESLFDEGFLGHGYALNDAQTRVPFVVVGLPVVVAEPLGQADLRDMLRSALGEPGHESAPRTVRSAKPVFQYLGALERPAQIAFTAADSQIAYDFRAQRVRLDRGQWVVPSSLRPTDAARWLELVNAWERMMIARAERRRGA